MVSVLAMPVVVGRKTAAERFAGATNTLTLEAMTGDGKALQMGTSHELGQNFARAFDITYSSAAGTREHAWTTSWGTSTRMLGGLIMCHGDDDGLRVPPRLAPVQAYVMVVKAGAGVIEAAAKLRDALRDAGVRVGLDDRVDTAFGRRAIDAELKGYPVRVEIGPRDLATGNAVLVRRRDGSKAPVPIASVVAEVVAALAADQQALYDEAVARRESATVDVGTLDGAIEAAGAGWARVPWSAVGVEGEARANAVAVTVRCLLRPDGSVPDSEAEPDLYAILARAY
jgi:prolyl-tRNA synthetase